MSPSNSGPVHARALLIQRGNELAEFASLLDSLEVPIDELSETLPSREELDSAQLAIVSGSRLIESGNPNLSLWPRTFAVVDKSTKTLEAHLHRLGVAMIIRRPIHPRTLRLLLLHEIYQGPERRTLKRVSIGHPIRTSGRLFKQRATLLELSRTGARIELPNAPKVGSKMSLLIGKDLTLSKPLKLQATVVRCIRPSGNVDRPEAEIGVAIDKPKKNAQAIAEILNRFSDGPASWHGKAVSPEDSYPELPPTELPVTVESAPKVVAVKQTLVEEPKEEESTGSLRTLPPAYSRREARPTPQVSVVATPAASPTPPEAVAEPQNEGVETQPEPAHETAAESGERRDDLRIPYERRIVALGEEAARVLVGRDLSTGGMRIESNDAVRVDDVFRIALHCGTDLEPLVLLATAQRSDGVEGIWLCFKDLSSTQHEHLEKIISSSCSIRAVADEDYPCGENDETESVVLGELLETVESGNVDLILDDEVIATPIDSVLDTDESVQDAR